MEIIVVMKTLGLDFVLLPMFLATVVIYRIKFFISGRYILGPQPPI